MSEFYKMAIRNIAKTGDTDIFPYPIEKYLFEDKPEEIEKILLEIDGNYDQICQDLKIDTIQTSLPVGYTGYRWATLIDPVWNAFYLAEVLKIAGQIEKKRIPVEENTVFSYRFSYDDEKGKLFNTEVGWKSYFKSAKIKAAEKKSVVMFDISDFYSRISHTQLRDVLLNEVEANPETVGRIMDLLAQFSCKNESCGLPIGGNASRILAEALLIKADNFLREEGIPFCRFVDDIIVYASTMDDAYSVLNRCADFFLRELGLALQKNKTVIMSSAKFKNHVDAILDEIEVKDNNKKSTDSTRSVIMKLNMRLDPYSLTADTDLLKQKEKVSGPGVIRLLKSECRKTRIHQMFGKQLLKAITYLNDKHISEAMRIISLNFNKLYPLFPVIMYNAYHLLPRCEEKAVLAFQAKVRELFEKNSFIIQTENNASYALRILSLASDEQSREMIRKLYEAERMLEQSQFLIRMNAFYAMINLRDEEWLSARMDEFAILSSWERRASMAAASFLGEKGRSWREKIGDECTPIENLVGDWVSEKHEDQPDWILPL